MLFNGLHVLPVAGLLLVFPHLLHAIGRSAAFTAALSHFLLWCLPLPVLQAAFYPLTNTLLACQRSLPLLYGSAAAFVAHIAANELLVARWGLGTTGSALALVSTYTIMVASLLCYAALDRAGLGRWLFGGGIARQSWHQLREYASLAYNSMGLRAIEYYSYTAVLLLSGFLPDADMVQAATAVGIEVLSIMVVPFYGIALATTAMVGSELGSGNPVGAKRVVFGGPLIHPFIVAILAAIALPPDNRASLVALLAAGASQQLRAALDWLLRWLVLHVAFDGMAAILASTLTGAGLQRIGLRVNAVVFPLLALPAALLLALRQGLGLHGLFYGMTSAPVVMVVIYFIVVARLNWPRLARIAQRRA